MSEEVENGRTKVVLPSGISGLEAQKLADLVLAIADGRAYTDRHVPEGMRLEQVFMPLAMGALSGMARTQLDDIGMVYEYVEKAGPLAVNGQPMFFSLRLLNKADTERVTEAVVAELERRKELRV